MSHSCRYYYTNPPSHYPPGALRTFAVPRVHIVSSTAARVEKVSSPLPDDNPHPHHHPQNGGKDNNNSGNNNSGNSDEDKAGVIAKLRRELQSLLRKNAELERELQYQRSKLQAAGSANALLEAKNLLLRGELQTSVVGCDVSEVVFGGGRANGYWSRRRRGSLDSQDSWCWGDDGEDE